MASKETQTYLQSSALYLSLISEFLTHNQRPLRKSIAWFSSCLPHRYETGAGTAMRPTFSTDVPIKWASQPEHPWHLGQASSVLHGSSGGRGCPTHAGCVASSSPCFYPPDARGNTPRPKLWQLKMAPVAQNALGDKTAPQLKTTALKFLNDLSWRNYDWYIYRTHTSLITRSFPWRMLGTYFKEVVIAKIVLELLFWKCLQSLKKILSTVSMVASPKALLQKYFENRIIRLMPLNAVLWRGKFSLTV